MTGHAPETAVRLLCSDGAVARTSLIIGNGRSQHERLTHALIAGARKGVLCTDDLRCPSTSRTWPPPCGNSRGPTRQPLPPGRPDALSRYDLGVRTARRDGLDASRLPSGRRADARLPGALDVRLDSRATQQRLRTRLRGAREFLGNAQLRAGGPRGAQNAKVRGAGWGRSA